MQSSVLFAHSVLRSVEQELTPLVSFLSFIGRSIWLGAVVMNRMVVCVPAVLAVYFPQSKQYQGVCQQHWLYISLSLNGVKVCVNSTGCTFPSVCGLRSTGWFSVNVTILSHLSVCVVPLLAAENKPIWMHAEEGRRWKL